MFRRPAHPCTESLLAAIPGNRSIRVGRAPKLVDAAVSVEGCSFQSRCPYWVPHCRTERPLLSPLAPGQTVACHRATELDLISPLPRIA
ncbi:MAG: hypothetical protein MO852_01150 [Candidatus Devosia euplotis]|nr:hypothetical protein [Candidatus Devosia euplotis]